MEIPELSSVVPNTTKRALRDGEELRRFEECLSSNPPPSMESFVLMEGEINREDVFYIDGVLSYEECTKLCLCLDESKELSFWSAAGRENTNARQFRDADTLEVASSNIAEVLWGRLQNLIPKVISPLRENAELGTIVIDNEFDSLGNCDARWERELVGSWVPCGLNHDLLFARYPTGGAFSPHTDGRAIHDFNKRSFYSVILFLNDIDAESGGGTKFYQHEALKQLRRSDGDQWTADASLMTCYVEPRAGRMLVFEQSRVHEGVSPTNGNQKYIMRSDVMFQRVPPICDSPRDRAAYLIFKEAEALAEDGRADDAVPIFRKAFKMSPDLAVAMGQG